MRLADAGRAEEDHILGALDEAELVQTLDLLAPQRRLKGEVEVVQLLHRRQPTRAHRRLQPAIVPELDLRRQQLLDGLGRAERAAIHALENRIERFQGARQAQVGQHVAQAVTA